MSVSASLFGSAILLLFMIVLAGLLKYKAWTFQGMKVMMSNRDNVPAPTPIAGRADRAANNMIENMVVFVALVVAVQLLEGNNQSAQVGASLFFWARLAYWPTYLFGIQYLRTGLWATGVAGLCIMGLTLI